MRDCSYGLGFELSILFFWLAVHSCRKGNLFRMHGRLRSLCLTTNHYSTAVYVSWKAQRKIDEKSLLKSRLCAARNSKHGPTVPKLTSALLRRKGMPISIDECVFHAHLAFCLSLCGPDIALMHLRIACRFQNMIYEDVHLGGCCGSPNAPNSHGIACISHPCWGVLPPMR